MTSDRDQRAAQWPGGLAGWIGRAWSQRGLHAQPRTLRVVESVSLGGQKRLHVVQCGTQRFLVGSGGEAVQAIVPLSVEGEPAGA